MEINFGTNSTKCAIIFDVNGNYGVSNGDLNLYGSEWNGDIYLPNGIRHFRINSYRWDKRIRIPNSVTNMDRSFSGCGSLNRRITIPASVTDMTWTFLSCGLYNQPTDIPNGVTNVYGMFSGCRNFNQSVSIPNTVLSTAYMLNTCPLYNRPTDIPDSVTNCYQMFNFCSNLNSSVILGNGVKNAEKMFTGCSRYNQPIAFPSGIESVDNCLNNCTNFNSTVTMPGACPNLKSVSGLFGYCRKYNQPFVIPPDAPNLNSLTGLFENCDVFNQPMDLPTHPARIRDMFANCSNFNAEVRFINTGSRQYNHTSYGSAWGMLRNCANYARPFSIGLQGIKMLNYMFCDTNRIPDIYISNFYILNVFQNDYSNMFRSNNAVRLNVHVPRTNVPPYFFNSYFIQGLIKPTLTELGDGNGWYNSQYNFYLYNNYVPEN